MKSAKKTLQDKFRGHSDEPGKVQDEIQQRGHIMPE